METPATPAHERHWPLDLPSGLPFERYEHRRLAARDILVHRIMNALFAPATLYLGQDRVTSLSATLAGPRRPLTRLRVACAYSNNGNNDEEDDDVVDNLRGLDITTRISIPYHNFPGLKTVDRGLARDVEVLRKMLVTRSASEWVQQDLVKPAKAVAAWPGVQPPVTLFWERDRGPPSTDQWPSIENEMLDLVRMHYLEMDDPVTRLWLGMTDAPRRSAYKTLQKKTAKQGSHKDHVQKRVAWHERNQAEDDKRWYPEEIAHLRALQRQTHVANERPLYEGGVFLPPLQRRVMESKAMRATYLHITMVNKSQSYFTNEHNGHEIQAEVYPWPEPHVPRRVLHAPSVLSWRQKQQFFRSEMPLVDFASGRTGRGLDRDGIWSTARWYGDDVPRGRTSRRRRRRAASEPPPGTFTTARLPVSFNSMREVLIFPKMPLSTMERRARRRSLSRTRIAEMFNWDITLEDPPPKPPTKPQFQELLPSLSKVLAGLLDQLNATEQPAPFLERYSALWDELYHRFEQRQLSIHPISSSTDAAALSAQHGASPPLKWMVDVDGGERFELREECNENGDVKINMYFHNLEATSPAPLCTNCASPSHETKKCRLPCGYCGAPNPNIEREHVDSARKTCRYLPGPFEDDHPKAGKHDNPHLASNCPVAWQNRCKCAPFPQFHPAAKCFVRCSRPCGNTTHPPGHFKHKNAMVCQSRCCMCGMPGHSGMKCKWKTCRCGGAHLGQDCAWHPACRVPGCDRFHCGVHCRACGIDRHTDGEAGFVLVGGLCPACAGGDASASAAKVKGRRKHKRTSRSGPKKAKEEKAWYAPLEPRTRAVVGVKSGKSAAKKQGHQEGG